ncbi:MFS transporter [Leclercia adecarboxylata]|uniref:MFS transporter n=1 Tax=Leclercia adecarboxylata TaxID=83655 RepID=UPI002DB77ABD|nr:MFS transporter [Leclercia adecarboxylata]MEB6379714.1 MFS transporter [Leclercia adecarboxylata]
MTSQTTGAVQRLATRIVFFIAGYVTATWAVLVPFAKANTGVNEATLGSLLLCLGMGALIAMPLTGMLTSRYGCRRVIITALAIVMLTTPLLAIIPDPRLLAAALLLFGVGVGVTDCAMNIQAIIVERDSPKPVMSGFHGMYSVGGIAGAGAMTLLLTLGASAFVACLIIILSVVIMLAFSLKGLLPWAHPASGPAFAVPRGVVLLIGAICFAVFLAEGTVLDWSAVFLTEVRGVPESLGGLGFTCFSVAMTLFRLTGDRLIARTGALRAVVGGAIVAAAGFALVTFVPLWELSLLGYVLVGAGCANIVPVMFSAVGRQTRMPQAVAVPAITTLGYLGVLAGPAIIGFVAHATSLTQAFMVIMVLMLVVAALSVTVTASQPARSEG